MAFVIAHGREWTRQLTAGDGYQCSNQRQLVFGLGQCEAVDRVDVSWPSRQRQSFSNLTVDREWILIEGRSSAIEITHGRE